ncbi:MAG: hypothetical protein VX185_00300 [Pseudomonadota bacterium]|nr:hypothetical protein [Pseudomonadota bacterium]
MSLDSYIDELVAQKKVFLSSLKETSSFNDFLLNLPWDITGTRIDFSKTNFKYKKLNYSELSDQEVYQCLLQLKIGTFSHIIILIDSDEACIVTDIEYGLLHLDELLAGSPGVSFICGATLNDKKLKSDYESLLMYDDGRYLVAVF